MQLRKTFKNKSYPVNFTKAIGELQHTTEIAACHNSSAVPEMAYQPHVPVSWVIHTGMQNPS